MTNDLRRPATVADCQNCDDDKFNHGPNSKGCWCLPYAVIVPKHVAPLLPIAGVQARREERPTCYHKKGWAHLAIPEDAA